MVALLGMIVGCRIFLLNMFNVVWISPLLTTFMKGIFFVEMDSQSLKLYTLGRCEG